MLSVLMPNKAPSAQDGDAFVKVLFSLFWTSMSHVSKLYIIRVLFFWLLFFSKITVHYPERATSSFSNDDKQIILSIYSMVIHYRFLVHLSNLCLCIFTKLIVRLVFRHCHLASA